MGGNRKRRTIARVIEKEDRKRGPKEQPRGGQMRESESGREERMVMWEGERERR